MAANSEKGIAKGACVLCNKGVSEFELFRFHKEAYA